MVTETKVTGSTDYTMPIARAIAKGGALVLVASLVGKGIKFATEVMLGRTLGPDRYGVYILGLSVLMVLIHFSSLGLKTGMLRFGAGYFALKEYSKFRSCLKFSLWVVIGGGLAVGLGLAFLGGYLADRIFNDGRLRVVFYLVAIGLPAYGAMWVVTQAIRAQKKIGFYAGLENIGQPLFFFILVSIGVLFGLTLRFTLSVFIISLVGVAFIGLIVLLRSSLFQSQGELLKKGSDYEPKRWLSYSMPLIIVGVSYMLLHETDRIMLGYFLDTKAVGVYNAAARLAYLTAIFVNSFAGIFSPMAAGFHQKNERGKIRVLLVITTRWILILTLPIASLLIMFPKFFLGWFGSQYTVATLPLSILVLAYITSSGTGNTGALLKMIDRQNVEVMNTVGVMVLNIILNVLLIPLYGILGAAMATGISIIVIQLIKLIEIKLFLGFTPYELNSFKPLLASLISGLVIFLINNYIQKFQFLTDFQLTILCILSFTLCYFLLLIIFGIEKEERRLLAQVRSVLTKTHL